jgi:integrase/recombinase XerD
MARTPSFKWKHEKGRGWVVNIPPSVSELNRRERCYFETRDEAKEYAQGLAKKYREHGSQSSGIRPALAEDATKAAKLLKDYGKTLTEAAAFLVKALKAEKASKLTGEAVDAWLVSCSSLRPRSLKSYKQTAKRIKEGLPARTLSTITAEEIAQAVGISNASGASAAVHYRNARAFWKWSAKKGWCNGDLFEKVDSPKAKKGSSISVLDPAEAETLMRTAETHFPQAVAHFALQLFAGIRAEEINRLTKKDVSPEGIELGEDATKTGSRRHITPSPTLSAWLRKHPFKPCANWDKVNAACRYLAGWKVIPDAATLESHPLDDEFEARPAWPQNVLRHSHASYSVAYGIPLQDLLFEFGHTASPAILRRHYVGRADKKQAIAYFAISPKGTKARKTIQAA